MLLRRFYERLGYFGSEEPIIMPGFVAIALQGVLFAHAYPFFRGEGAALTEGLRFAFLFGAFLVSTQVVAAAAKHHAPPSAEWFVVETAYLAVQFLLVGCAYALIHGRRKGNPGA